MSTPLRNVNPFCFEPSTTFLLSADDENEQEARYKVVSPAMVAYNAYNTI